MKEIPIKELGWRTHIHQGTASAIEVLYLLKVGPTKHTSKPVTLDEKVRRALEHVIAWSLNQFDPPQSYKILGQTITPTFEVTYVNRAIVGDIFGSPEGSFRADILVRHPSKEERGPSKFWSETELPSDMRGLLRLIDEFVWKKMREDLIHRFRLPKDTIPAHSPEHVFIAYREGNSLGRDIAKKLGRYLSQKRVRVWLFPWRVGWGDSITKEEEEGIGGAFASVIVFTRDFLEGPSATEEYRALMAKKRDDPEFKVGLLLVGVNGDKIPPLMKDYFYARIGKLDDPRFEQQSNFIYRGILGLPREEPE